ncbi:threonine/serine exporter family protein [Clostridium aestuarii]|uniref:Threonine/serine exporter family protein n=1 Tax=Clostridium aestuarii TaxID=338193 RepID=A0ABT4CXB5_9CLOT|nr:threonine/serine exporter family protein [Clostridium aestuarii]MCY6483633.1 threonine/serine exporter family protein [Clostridium aestuarii]
MNKNNKIIHIAAEAGRIILQNGGETYRVEETMIKICYAFNVRQVNAIVIPTGIMISITDEKGEILSLIKRIHNRTINLEKISQVNSLSRAIAQSSLSLDYIENRLNTIDNMTSYNNKILILAASFVAGFFTLLFGGSIQDFFVALIIGAVIKIISCFLNRLNINEFFINSLGGAASALIALISVHLNIGQSKDKIIIGSIMLLVPGLVITNAIRDTIAGDLVSGVSRATEAFFIAIAIAIGTGIVIKFWFHFTGGIIQ